jgi:hypothetical protein
MTLLIASVMAALVALSLAACRAKRPSSKAMILGFLLLILVLVWIYMVGALGVLAAHESPQTVAKWPSPGLLAIIGLVCFAAISSLAFLQKQD